MSLWCDLALAVGLSFNTCAPPAVVVESLPPEDRKAWTFKLRKKAPKPVVPKLTPPPTFPPVVIERVVHVQASSPPAVPSPPIPRPRRKPVKPVKPDWTQLSMEASYNLRSDTAAAWPSSVTVPTGEQRRSALSPMAASLGASVPSSTATPSLETGRYEEDYRLSSLPVSNERIVTTDRYISGTVESGINSQLVAGDESGGEVVIQVSRDVFGYHGRNILIPKGSRLVCGYKSPKVGETRLAIKCGRVLLGGSRAEILQASANIYDAQARWGVTGEVDTRFWEKYGTAIVLAGISGAVRAAAASIPTTDGDVNFAAEGAEELSERFGEITASVLEETVNLNPIVTLSQGSRIVIRPGRDWYIRKLEAPIKIARQEKERVNE